MKKVLLSVGLLAALSVSGDSFAQTKKVNPWKHCGIGAMIFDDNPTAAALSNIIWDLGTTAVTSNTVSRDTCDSKEIASAQFIEDNFDQLANELAVGEGEAVDALLEMTNAKVVDLRKSLLENLDASRSEKAQALYFAAI